MVDPALLEAEDIDDLAEIVEGILKAVRRKELLKELGGQGLVLLAYVVRHCQIATDSTKLAIMKVWEKDEKHKERR